MKAVVHRLFIYLFENDFFPPRGTQARIESRWFCHTCDMCCLYFAETYEM